MIIANGAKESPSFSVMEGKKKREGKRKRRRKKKTREKKKRKEEKKQEEGKEMEPSIHGHFITSCLTRSLVPGLTKPRYNRQPTELMKAKLKGQSLLINLRRTRKKQMTGVQATKRWWTRVFGTPRRVDRSVHAHRALSGLSDGGHNVLCNGVGGWELEPTAACQRAIIIIWRSVRRGFSLIRVCMSVEEWRKVIVCALVHKTCEEAHMILCEDW